MTYKSDKFCLKWRNFQKNITTSYRELRDSTDFSDVSLVCEDDQQIEAHRIILSACSPFFMNILNKNKHTHPMIYMRGTKTKDLLAILDFVYHGEASVDQEDLENFLELAEELQLKGLTGGDTERDVKENLDFDDCTKSYKSTNETEIQITEKSDKELQLKGLIEEDTERDVIENLDFDDCAKSNKSTNETGIKFIEKADKKKDIPTKYLDVSSNENESVAAINDFKSLSVPKENMKELDDKIHSMIRKIGETKEWTCTVCGKISDYKSNLERHIEANHIYDGGSYACNQCVGVFRLNFYYTNSTFIHVIHHGLVIFVTFVTGPDTPG